MSTESRLDTKPSDGRLRGGMGVFDVMFTVIAYNAPAVVFLGALPVAMLIGNGAGTPVLFLVAGALLMALGTGLLNLSQSMKRPGGFYAIVSVGLGKVPGLGVGFAAILTYFCALLGAYCIGPIGLMNLLETELGAPAIPWWVAGVVMVAAIGVLGFLNIQFSARVLYVFLGCEFLMILVYIVAVFVRGGASGIGFTSFTPDSIFSGSLAAGLLFAILCFGGFEATVIFREEVTNPDRTIKRATYGTVALIAISYALLAWAFVNAYGPNAVMAALEEDVTGAAAASVRDYVGEGGYVVANVLLVTSSFALGLAAHNVLTRYVYNFGQDGILPTSVGVTHPRQGSPYIASMVISVLSLVGVAVMAVAPVASGTLYATTAGLLSYGMIIMLVVVSLAAGVYMMRTGSSSRMHAALMFFVCLILTAVLISASVRFDLLSGLAGTSAVVAMALCWAFILAGSGVALICRWKKPAVYARIGREEAAAHDE
ncbi:APC family permease [Mycobacterium sp. AT1]|uniref:APC family permease n=1 Tax=Mycobacterium sp. AT1 TaxID=1961706 RepID=UPI0009AE0B45|nr:APC family permease [Mycobacterium sp. AT1]